MEIVGESPTITPVELEPPVKRKRGRPKKAAVAGAPNIPEPSSVSLPTPATETNRFSGRMSLRPNRRVDVNKGDFEVFNVGNNGSVHIIHLSLQTLLST
jgi:hypothetical protein